MKVWKAGPRWARRWAAGTFALVLMVSPLHAAPASAGIDGEDASTDREAGPRHHYIWDFLAMYAAMGTVAGVVEGHCRSETIHAAPIAGHVITGGVFSLFGTNGADFLEHRSVSTLEALRQKSLPRLPVEVRTRDGETITGRYSGVKEGGLVVEGDGQRRVIPEASILTVRTGPEGPWDGAVWGAGGGALYALIWANNCRHDPVTYVSRGRMAAYGATILGLTGLTLDFLHGGRPVVFRAEGTTRSSSLRVTPILAPDRALLTVSWGF